MEGGAQESGMTAFLTTIMVEVAGWQAADNYLEFTDKISLSFLTHTHFISNTKYQILV